MAHSDASANGTSPSAAQNQPSPPWTWRGRFSLFRWPIIVLVMQLGLLIGTISFLAWSWKGHSTQSITNKFEYQMYSLYPQYPTVLTLFGSLISAFTTFLFAQAVRFAIHVSLRRNKDLSLYELYAASSIASKSPLLDWNGLNGSRRPWVVISIISCLFFVVQTSAWTTIITPKTQSSHSTKGHFYDFNFSTPVLANAPFDTASSTFLREAASGMVAVQDVAEAAGFLDPSSLQGNVSRFLPYSDFVLNGTSYGIMPQVPNTKYDYIKVVQQGLTANVSCVETPEPDPAVQLNFTQLNTRYKEATLKCVNGNPSKITGSGQVVLDPSPTTYGVFAVCPFDVAESIFLYLQIGGNFFTDSSGNALPPVNMTCSINPQILNVNVTYNKTGFVTLEPVLNTSTTPPINTLATISATMSALEYHLSIAQAPDMNLAVEGIYGAYSLYPSSGDGDYEPLAGLMAAYIRGVIENEATSLRYALSLLTDSRQVPRQAVQAMIYETFVSWGPSNPKYKLLVVAAPLLVMLSTIAIVSVAFYLAWPLQWTDSDMSFDSMSIIHLVIALSIGGTLPLGSLDFKGYDKKSVYDKSEDVRCWLSGPNVKGRERLRVTGWPEPSEPPLPPPGSSRR